MIGGLIVAGTRADDEEIPADDPTPTIPAAPEPAALGLTLPATVTYYDWEWEIQDVFTSSLVDDTSTAADDDPDTDYIHVVVGITNPAADGENTSLQLGHRGLTSLSVPGVAEPLQAEEVWDEAHEPLRNSLSLGGGEGAVRQWSFAVPAGTDPSSTTFTLAVDEGRGTGAPVVIPFAGPAPVEPQVDVTLAETEFGGPYSTGDVDFVVVDSFASLNRGVYDDGRMRPGGQNRRAEQGFVYVTIELQATVTSGGEVEEGQHHIVTDGDIENFCITDAPPSFSETPVLYTASCEVPIDSSTFVLRMSSDKDDGDGRTTDHEITIDPEFATAFEG